MNRLSSTLALLAAASLSASPISPPVPRSSSEILWYIQKLDTLGKVLYVAAHPDDENTALISYLSLGEKYDTAYLSLTRGDGGQNLIGKELRDALGVIRTQELLAARRLDGGRQFFTRAKDFGFSKHPDETLRIWDKEAVLADTVWVIRNFRPDIIITRFSPEPGFTHGHHTASTLLALEAFEAAADPARFPEQLEFVEPWQAKRVVWNASSFFFRRSGQIFDESQYLKLDAGGYEPLLGKSFNEIASASRSQHRSQGFGSRIARGSRPEYFKLLAGEAMQDSLFDGVDTTWSRVENSDTVRRNIHTLAAAFDPTDPAASLPNLIALRRSLLTLGSNPWALAKLRETDAIIADCLGLNLRALLGQPYLLPGESMPVALEAINRSPASVAIKSLRVPVADLAAAVELVLPENERIETAITVSFPQDLPLPQPYWLIEEGTLGMSAVSDLQQIGKAENDPPIQVLATVEVEGEFLEFALPLQHSRVDPAQGEIVSAVLNVPPASVEFLAPVTLFPNYQARSVEVQVAASTQAIAGELRLDLPFGWEASPASHEVEEIAPGDSGVFAFRITPPQASGEASLLAVFETEGKTVSKSMQRIRYPHIPEQLVFAPAVTRAVSLQVARRGNRVGYLAGAGDTVAESIREIGFEVRELSPEQLQAASLEDLDSVVIGIRAYNTVEQMDRIAPLLFDFAERGGTVITQYNTSRGLQSEKFAPYPLRLSRDRVTDENAEMRILAPGHPVVNTPNKIGPEDFEGWTQERGLYFPSSWDEAFVPIFSSNDQGEPPRNGSLLIARHGEGYIVYTGLSWFRQLPAGVPGAYRIFANLVSLGHEE